MRKIYLLIIGLFIVSSAFADTQVGGTVSGTWTLENSPYNVIDSLEIPVNTTLVIEPGVLVNFQGHYKFKVYGRLLAIGTEQDTITFTAQDTALGWHGLRFYNTNSTGQDTSKIIYCKLEYGKAEGPDEEDNLGGAIYCNNSNIVIKNCLICNNNSQCMTEPYSSGGGIYCWQSSPQIVDNIIKNNAADFFGGGICSRYCPSITIINNVIKNNRIAYLYGGGIYGFSVDELIIENNIILENISYYGSGIYFDSCWLTEIYNNVISNNSATFYGGGIFIGLTGLDSAKVKNNIIIYNSGQRGAGIYLKWQNYTNIINNVICNNFASSKGGGIYQDYTNSTWIFNDIIWGNYAPQYPQLFVVNSVTDVNYSDIQGGYTGIGNIDIDPMFVDSTNGDWHLQSISPCIDAGDPTSQYNDPEDPNNPGYAMWPAQGTIRNDMGVYGGPYACDWGIQTSNDIIPYVIPNSIYLYQNYPNPFNPETVIAYQLPEETEVEISIYNILGQKVKTLVKGRIDAGYHKVIWNGKDADGNDVSSGIYFYKINTDKFSETKKMLLMK